MAVDLVLLTLGRPTASEPAGLGVVTLAGQDTYGRRVLPGRFIRESQTVIDTAAATLEHKVGLVTRRRISLDMIGVYDAPGRDARGWAISLAHQAVLLPQEVASLSPDVVQVLPVGGPADKKRRVTSERLGFDHDDMVTTALRRARRRYERYPDPLGLLPPPFTLSQLRHVHDAVLGERVKRDTFNRRMTPLLVPVTTSAGEPLVSQTGGRPAQLYRPMTKADRDLEAGPFPLPRAERSH